VHVLERDGRTYGWPSLRGEIEDVLDMVLGFGRFLGICSFLAAYEKKGEVFTHILLFFFAVSSVAASDK
jgi:hypothetical protein